MLLIKFQRLIFLLITLEFLIMLIFFDFAFDLTRFFYFYFLNFRVVSRVLGILIIVFILKVFGVDKVLF
jgi:hypothetical protein